VLALSVAVAPANDFFGHWRHYQGTFLKLIRSRPNGAALERHFESGIHQVWIPEQGVVDRCTTCHLGLKEASLSDVHEQPFRPHPPIPHSLTEFGCVTCHRGQGAATSVEEAHRQTESWEQPLLPARYLESSCGQCHLGELYGTPELNLGRRLLARYGCTRCHTISQPDGNPLVPTNSPSPLTRIAEKTTREWLYTWIKDPQAYAASATMPNFQFNEQQAADIASFLMAQSTPSGRLTEIRVNEAKAPRHPGTAGDGASLFGSSFCTSCHASQNAAGDVAGGDLGPELTRIGSKVKREWLRQWLQDPRSYNPRTRMPHYRFSERQVAVLSDFLLAKKDEDLLAGVHLPPADDASVARGKKLASDFGCAACHEINGLNRPQALAPDLSRIGSKPLAQIVSYSPATGSLPDYISAKIRDPRSFGSRLKMPKYNFSKAQITALTTALLAQTDRAWNEPKNLLHSAPRPTSYHAGGEGGQLLEDLRCQSCHTINGNGGDMAPELTWEGSAVQRKWLESFMKDPNTLRPALIRRMPDFNLTRSEVKTISDYIISACQHPTLDPRAPGEHALTTEAAERGRNLFYTKYACQSCHIADFKKDKGYIGPTLIAVGNRRPASWIYQWLKNPQVLRPGTLMPAMNPSDDEARDLTAFLMTLKARENGASK
jgi:mono/diheme cytochrome c family protein